MQTYALSATSLPQFLQNIITSPLYKKYLYTYYKGTVCLLSTKNGTLCYYFYMIQIEEIQKRLRDAIKYSNVSQKELAEKLGINPSTVSKYMRLDKFPSIDTFANICKILDVSADEILGLK